ncbi:MAG: hypothetical protein A3F78_14590 [Burkholderiales bacterium RIFCSPLOWO2_12_FULL_61_40]|nr:MAG: hypothetical protein A3F78_14590 [Burkholderiales bacterium RIFCSPLOWO2_12_FULL_61_40]
MKAHSLSDPCPCGRTSAKGRPAVYGHCCGQWLEADKPAPDALSLMRSRYSAFRLEREAYLLATWHSSHRPSHVEFEPGVKWLGLEVRAFVAQDASHAAVEFVARQKPATGPAVRLHERSRFVLEDGRWVYVDGDAL